MLNLVPGFHSSIKRVKRFPQNKFCCVAVASHINPVLPGGGGGEGALNRDGAILYWLDRSCEFDRLVDRRSLTDSLGVLRRLSVKTSFSSELTEEYR